jgi:hypothetical protein
VVKFVLAMHEPRVRFTAATFLLLLGRIMNMSLKEGHVDTVRSTAEGKTFGIYKQVVTLEDRT